MTIMQTAVPTTAPIQQQLPYPDFIARVMKGVTITVDNCRFRRKNKNAELAFTVSLRVGEDKVRSLARTIFFDVNDLVTPIEEYDETVQMTAGYLFNLFMLDCLFGQLKELKMSDVGEQ